MATQCKKCKHAYFKNQTDYMRHRWAKHPYKWAGRKKSNLDGVKLFRASTGGAISKKHVVIAAPDGLRYCTTCGFNVPWAVKK